MVVKISSRLNGKQGSVSMWRNEDCTPQVAKNPKCPDPTWTLWGVSGQLSNGGWCCLAGASGTYWTNPLSFGCLAKPAASSNQTWAQTVATSSCTATPTSKSTSTSVLTSSSAALSAPSSSRPASSASTVGVPPTTSAADAGLSTPAVAGVAVGAAIGTALLLAAGAALLWWTRRRGRAGESAAGAATMSPESGGKGGCGFAQEMGNEETVEMDGVRTVELGSGERVEVVGVGVVSELGGSEVWVGAEGRRGGGGDGGGGVERGG
ncbi:uncharacterized protein CTRU02_10139 [Neofusicoccum parvum]|uniref:Uncharacterized protein CTRU02_10139 n=1 Tax=Neofusicoccum parvum TaxID=310453 RepID=A0ACB5S8S6_9PEZI|nr:uncharacterized protein CTRU02_10139 [Neofusicoccum parvum]